MLQLRDDFGQWVQGWSTEAPTTYQGSETLAYQRWFKFKEAFSPALVHQVINDLGFRPAHVLDCFGGSGTTGMVARLAGIPATLIEVNPFLADLIEAKLSNYAGLNLPLATSHLLSRAAQIDVKIAALRDRLPPTFIEPGVDQRWIFGKSAAKAIERIRLAIEDEENPTLKRLFNTALGSILIELSNVRIDGKGRRYRSNWESRRVDAATVKENFIRLMSEMIEDISCFPWVEKTDVNVLRGDARKEIKNVSKSVDLAIFSPPYPNSFDYTDIYNVELWMMGYFSGAQDNRSLRLETLRSHVQVKWDEPILRLNSKTLDDTIKKLDAVRKSLWNQRIPEMIHAYFEDLDTIIGDIKSKLSKDGRIVIVVGNSSYRSILIDTNAILGELAHARGLEIEKSESVRVMRSSMQQNKGDRVLDEWLIQFKRI